MKVFCHQRKCAMKVFCHQRMIGHVLVYSNDTCHRAPTVIDSAGAKPAQAQRLNAWQDTRLDFLHGLSANHIPRDGCLFGAVALGQSQTACYQSKGPFSKMASDREFCTLFPIKLWFSNRKKTTYGKISHSQDARPYYGTNSRTLIFTRKVSVRECQSETLVIGRYSLKKLWFSAHNLGITLVFI